MNIKVSEIFGKVNASESEIDRIAYSTDASRVPGEASLVLQPVRTEQVHKFIQYARRSRMTIVPRGAGTGIVGGAVPLDGAVVMDMSKMNRILAVGEDYVVVEAGAVFSDVNRLLKRRGLQIPLDSEVNEFRSIGGMIATNAVGMRIMEHGRMEDWVEEVSIVDGTGRFSRLSSDEAANICGSEGTTGVIVSARLRVAPLFSGRTLSVLSFNTVTSMMEKVDELKENEHVKMVYYVDDTCAGLLDLDPKLHLFVEYDNDEGVISDQAEMDSAFETLFSLDAKLKGHKKTVREDPRVPSSELAKFLGWLRKYGIPSFGNVDVGLIHPYFSDSNRYERNELYKVVRSVNGSVGWEHGLGLSKKEHASADRRRKAEILKKHYDPGDLMNRGKVL